MLEAGFWGFVGGAALLVGAVAGLWLPVSQRVIGLIMAFGSGVLISALAFELTDEAFRRGGPDAVAVGLAGGALAFFAGDWVVDRRGGEHRKRSGGEQAGGSPRAVGVGAPLHGIPQLIRLRVSPLGGPGVRRRGGAPGVPSHIPRTLS